MLIAGVRSELTQSAGAECMSACGPARSVLRLHARKRFAASNGRHAHAYHATV